ncbi:MAG: hypothetical protein K6T54_09240, partial [Ignavibacterium sp.]|nr:hypothetical protein [Ignavibacterium sp.]
MGTNFISIASLGNVLLSSVTVKFNVDAVGDTFDIITESITVVFGISTFCIELGLTLITGAANVVPLGL